MRNETRNVPPPSSPPSRRQLGGVVGIDPPLFSLRRGYKHVRLGPFACCNPMTVTCILRGTFPERTCTKAYAYPPCILRDFTFSLFPGLSIFSSWSLFIYGVSRSAVILIFLRLSSNSCRRDDGSFDRTMKEWIPIDLQYLSIQVKRFPVQE